MIRLGYQESYNPPNEADWTASNSIALVMESPYARRPWPWPPPAPMSRDSSATTQPEAEVSNDSLLRQVLAQFSNELRSPMPEEVIAQIEKETPEMPAQYDRATYEYKYVKELDEDPA